MTEQELREKIKSAIENGFKKADCRKPYTNEPYPYFDSQINAIADALIEAEIGDVSEYKHRADEIKRLKSENAELTRKYRELELTLFTVVRNFKVLPVGLRLGKTQQEITDMTLKTIKEIKKLIDYNAVEELIKEQ